MEDCEDDDPFDFKGIVDAIWKALDRDGNRPVVAAQASPRSGSNPSATPVVLVHGLGLSSIYMLPTLAALARDFRVYAPDFPGVGRSGKPACVHDVAHLGDALAQWMDAFGLERAALLGNSLGSQIIVECLARHPQRATPAVLQGPTRRRTSAAGCGRPSVGAKTRTYGR